MNIQATLDKLTATAKEVEALQKRAKKMRQDAMEPFLAELATTGLVSLITIRGYTPGFNDGEPCEHSADFWVNIQQHAADEIETDELEFLDELVGSRLPFSRTLGRKEPIFWRPTDEDHKQNTLVCAAHGHVYDAPPAEIMDAIRQVVFNTIEEEYGTDYFVQFILKDGKFVRREGDYDCGY